MPSKPIGLHADGSRCYTEGCSKDHPKIPLSKERSIRSEAFMMLGFAESKVCSKCQKELPSSSFLLVKENKDGLSGVCLRCNRERYESNYARHKDAIYASAIARQKRNKEFLSEYKKSHPCVDCGFNDERALDFDHRQEEVKLFNLGKAAHSGFSLRKIRAEITKCDVRCANCHMKKTYNERGGSWRTGFLKPLEGLTPRQVSAEIRRRKAQALILEYCRGGCVGCGNKELAVLELDHVRGVKSKAVARMILGNTPISVLKEELLKCDPRCRNCHRIVTQERLGVRTY